MEKNKERLREQAKNKYKELSEKEKNIQREHGRNRYQKMSEVTKQILKECLFIWCQLDGNKIPRSST